MKVKNKKVIVNLFMFFRGEIYDENMKLDVWFRVYVIEEFVSNLRV